MASRKEMADFLHLVQHRAYKQARYAVQQQQAALDIVQQTMHALASRFPHAPAALLPLVFQRLLHKAVRRHLSRSARQGFFRKLLQGLVPTRQADDSAHPLEALDIAADEARQQPEAWLLRKEVAHMIDAVMPLLPAKEREAFLLHYWHGLSIGDTANALACTQSGARQYCARASQTLQAILQQKGVTPPDNWQDKIVRILDNSSTLLGETGQAGLAQAQQQALAAFDQHAGHTASQQAGLALWLIVHARRLRFALLGSCLVLLLLTGLWFINGNSDDAAVDAAILSQELPLDALMDPHFSGALHE